MSIGLKEKLLSTQKQNSTQYDTSLFRKLYLTYLKKMSTPPSTFFFKNHP